MPSSPLICMSLLFLIHFSGTLAQQCYYRDGSEAPIIYTPCNTTANATTCCGYDEACLSSGLCYSATFMSFSTGTCTDKTWQSPRCFQKCPGVENQAAPNTLWRCFDNLWCCSAAGKTTSCCNPGIDVFTNEPSLIFNGSAFSPGYTVVPVSDVISTTTSSSKVSATETASGNSSCSAALPTASMSGVPGGDAGAACPALADEMGEVKMRVGLGVGLGMGVPLLAALAGLLWLLRRERVCNRELKGRVDGVSSSGNGKGVAGWNACGNDGHWPEMHGSDGAHEMAGTEARRELDGGRGGRS